MARDGRPSVAIVGVNPFGCFLAGMLASDCAVTLIGDRKKIEVVNSQGIFLRQPSHQVVHVSPSSLTATDQAEALGETEFLIMSSISDGRYDSMEAIAQHTSENVEVISLSDGLDEAAMIEEKLSYLGRPDIKVASGLVPFRVVRNRESVLFPTRRRPILLQNEPELSLLVERGSAIPFEMVANLGARQAGWFLRTLNDPIQALSGKSIHDELLDRNYRRCVAACMDEALAAFAVEGTQPVGITVPFSLSQLPRVFRLPTRTFRRVASHLLRDYPEPLTRVADALRLGERTNINRLQGYVSQLGRRVGIATPACDRVVELVRLAEEAITDLPEVTQEKPRNGTKFVAAARTRSIGRHGVNHQEADPTVPARRRTYWPGGLLYKEVTAAKE